MARKNGQNHDIESIYEPNIKSARYGEQEERVLARIISKIKEFILYYGFTKATLQYRDGVWARIIAKIKKFILDYGFTKATLQRRENQEIGGVLARECGRNWTL